jgi:hypothetical protein
MRVYEECVRVRVCEEECFRCIPPLTFTCKLLNFLLTYSHRRTHSPLSRELFLHTHSHANTFLVLSPYSSSYTLTGKHMLPCTLSPASTFLLVHSYGRMHSFSSHIRTHSSSHILTSQDISPRKFSPTNIFLLALSPANTFLLVNSQRCEHISPRTFSQAKRFASDALSSSHSDTHTHTRTTLTCEHIPPHTPWHTSARTTLTGGNIPPHTLLTQIHSHKSHMQEYSSSHTPAHVHTNAHRRTLLLTPDRYTRILSHGNAFLLAGRTQSSSHLARTRVYFHTGTHSFSQGEHNPPRVLSREHIPPGYTLTDEHITSRAITDEHIPPCIVRLRVCGEKRVGM